jgi:hypothetical protein
MLISLVFHNKIFKSARKRRFPEITQERQREREKEKETEKGSRHPINAATLIIFLPVIYSSNST